MRWIVSIPISQEKKLRHGEMKQLARGHTTSKWQNRAMNPGLPDTKIFLLTPSFFRWGPWSFGSELSGVLVKIKDSWNGRLWVGDVGMYHNYTRWFQMSWSLKNKVLSKATNNAHGWEALSWHFRSGPLSGQGRASIPGAQLSPV